MGEWTYFGGDAIRMGGSGIASYGKDRRAGGRQQVPFPRLQIFPQIYSHPIDQPPPPHRRARSAAHVPHGTALHTETWYLLTLTERDLPPFDRWDLVVQQQQKKPSLPHGRANHLKEIYQALRISAEDQPRVGQIGRGRPGFVLVPGFVRNEKNIGGVFFACQLVVKVKALLLDLGLETRKTLGEIEKGIWEYMIPKNREFVGEDRWEELGGSQQLTANRLFLLCVPRSDQALRNSHRGQLTIPPGRPPRENGNLKKHDMLFGRTNNIKHSCHEFEE